MYYSKVPPHLNHIATLLCDVSLMLFFRHWYFTR